MIPLKFRRLVVAGSAALIGAAVAWFVVSSRSEAPTVAQAESGIPAEAPVPKVDPADHAARMAAVQRYLRASEYIVTLRVTVREVVKLLGPELQASGAAPSNPDPLASIDVAAAEAAVAPLVARHLTLAQVNEITAFYESEAGHYLVRQSQRGELAPPDTTAAGPHEAAIEKFFSSETGRLLMAVNGEPEIAQTVMRLAGNQSPR